MNDLSALFTQLRKSVETQFGVKLDDLKTNKPPKKNETLFDNTLPTSDSNDIYNGMISISGNNNSTTVQDNVNDKVNDSPVVSSVSNTNTQKYTNAELLEAVNEAKAATEEYVEKMGNRRLKFTYNFNGNSGSTISEDFSYACLSADNTNFIGKYRLINSDGNIVVSSVNDIPGIEQKIPVYAKVDSSGNFLTETKDVYTKTSEELGANERELYITYLDSDGTYKYVKIQNADGTPNLDAEINSMKVFDSESKLMLESYKNYQRYTKSVSSDYITTTEDMSGNDNYKIAYFRTVTAPRPQASDGYYYSDDGRKYIINSAIEDVDYFQNALRDNTLTLQKANVVDIRDSQGNIAGIKTMWESTPWQGMPFIKDILNTEDDAMAEAEYESKMVKLKDKLAEFDKIATEYIDKTKLAEAEKEYNEKISNRKLRFVYNLNGNGNQSMYEDLTYASLSANNPHFVGEYRLINSDGNIVVSSIDDIPLREVKVGNQKIFALREQSLDGYYYSDDGRKYIINPAVGNTNYFQNALRDNTFTLQKANLVEIKDNNGNKIGENTMWENTPWQSIDVISDVLNTEDDALAESEYEKKVADLKYEAFLKYMKENL